MAFEFRDEMIHEYLEQGYLVFRGILPPALVRDLRRECDKARKMAHELHGPQAQRIQPIANYADRIDLKPFRDYAQLPALNDAIGRLLGPGYTFGYPDIIGILVEPLDRPWNLGWHRDGVVEVPPEAYDAEIEAFLGAAWHRLDFWNQVNCAVYPDSCTWYCPGSHLRQRDIPGERQGAFDQRIKQMNELPTAEEVERAAYEYCATFPNAVQVHMQGGDFMVYRQLAWHNGNYSPLAPRATIHEFVKSPKWDEFAPRWQQAKREAVARMEKRKAGGV